MAWRKIVGSGDDEREPLEARAATGFRGHLTKLDMIRSIQVPGL